VSSQVTRATVFRAWTWTNAKSTTADVHSTRTSSVSIRPDHEPANLALTVFYCIYCSSVFSDINTVLLVTTTTTTTTLLITIIEEKEEEEQNSVKTRKWFVFWLSWMDIGHVIMCVSVIMSVIMFGTCSSSRICSVIIRHPFDYFPFIVLCLLVRCLYSQTTCLYPILFAYLSARQLSLAVASRVVYRLVSLFV